MKGKRILIIAALVVMVLSCASVQTKSHDVDLLRQRINAFYAAKIESDHKEAFKFENMSLDERFTEKFYITNASKSPMQFLDVRILSIELNDTKDVATVKMEAHVKLMPISNFEKFEGEKTLPFEDRWEFKEGNWYHLIKGMTQYW